MVLRRVEECLYTSDARLVALGIMYTHTHKHTHTQTHKHTNTQTHRHTDRHTSCIILMRFFFILLCILF